MTTDHAIAPSQLMAEIAEIDVLLMQYEDWRALLQLETREKQGDAVRSVNGETLKALLLESLSSNALFARRQLLLAELEKVARELQRLGPRPDALQTAVATSGQSKPRHDDLTTIAGIDARLAKRLNILDVKSFAQIANWTPDDVEYVANTLGLDQLIVTQDWIGQAACLVQSHDVIAPASDAWAHAQNGPGASTSAPAASVSAPSVAEPQVKAEHHTPARDADVKAVVAPAVAAVVAVPVEPLEDVSWKRLIPASPLAAQNYKTDSAPAPSIPPGIAISVPEKLPNPSMPLAARHYAGAVLEPKHDGATYSTLVPAKPLPAPAYHQAALATPAATTVPAPVVAPAAQLVTQNAANPKDNHSKAAEILQHTLPPLPLRPSTLPVPNPTPVAQPMAPAPVANASATAATTSEALLLAVVAARSPLVAGAAPPPLPAGSMNGKGQDTRPPSQVAAVSETRARPSVAPPPLLNDVEPGSRQATVEARVTIKRAEEALSNTVLRTPGGTEVYLGARRASPHDEFDGTSYAAYRGSIEEASVQIVRRPPATKTPVVPPPQTLEVASAAQAAARSAAQASRIPAAEADPTAGSTMGRFLKALTGQ